MYSADCTLLGAKDIYNILIKKGVSRFHHANTVKSALSFISEGALLSRSFIESNSDTESIILDIQQYCIYHNHMIFC